MKKTIIVSVSIIFSIIGALGFLTLFIYTRSFEIDYSGRARLDYNWKYYFTACPKEEYKYDGKLFSFSYPRIEEKNTLKVTSDITGGVIFAYLIDLRWYEKSEKNIKSELAGYLSGPYGKISAVPSPSLMKWLTGFESNSSVYVEKIKLKNSGSAILMSGRGKDHGYLPGLDTNPYHKYVYISGLTPNGVVFKAYILVPLNLPEDLYRERVFGPTITCSIYPSAERDAKGVCVLDRFLKTFEIKKQ